MINRFIPLLLLTTLSTNASGASIDFGVIPVGVDHVVVRYEHRNASKSVLNVEKVSSSCGCTTVESSPAIAPGEVGEFVFKVAPRDAVGEVLANVTIRFASDDAADVDLALRGFHQNATLTQQVMFADVSHETEADIELQRVLSLKVFDRSQPEVLTRDNWHFDDKKFQLVQSTFTDNDRIVEVGGEIWYYSERAYRLVIKPRQFETGIISETIEFRYAPFDNPVNGALQEKRTGLRYVFASEDAGRYSLPVQVTGRVLGSFYTMPSNLTFLLDADAPSDSISKRFTLFNSEDESYHIEYDRSTFTLTETDGKFELRFVPGAVRKILETHSGKFFPAPIILTTDDSSEKFVIPISAIIY